MEQTPLLVIGAGPYGLSTAAWAKRCGIEPLVLGEPMGFWKRNMPEGMLLRSGSEWQLDPSRAYSLSAYLDERGIDEEQVTPLSVDLFVAYADWFVERSELGIRNEFVTRLVLANGRGFVATLADGKSIAADAVVAAPGVAYFAYTPAEIEQRVPPDRLFHACWMTNFAELEGERVLIIGGRQSAFEWAALLAEQRQMEIDIVYRHETPSFEESDWSVADRLLEKTVRERGWFRRLPRQEQEAIRKRLFLEGRLRLEPWLPSRLPEETVRLWPKREVVAYKERPGGEIEARLSSGETLVADTVLAATGYRVDVARVPYLSDPDLTARLEVADGYPVLDEDFQASVLNLFIPGRTAMRDFGPIFGFVAGAPAAARIIVSKLVTADGAASRPQLIRGL